ncbi:hypothetical protein C8Q76DRAFT_798258 [Earliella scabrosa]|nr:hypothetical protein C8Q76DRAFT_798258 [Earliella scabrosa]
MYALSFAFLTVLAGQVAGEGLLVRQDNGEINGQSIPEQCRSDCGALSTYSGCTDITCACTEDIHSGIVNCFQCYLTLEGANQTTFDVAQAELNGYTDACRAAGFDITPITLSQNSATAVALSSAALMAVVGVAMSVFVL